MIFNELRLSNFCIYGGEHEFNLAPAAHRRRARPIVQFGGMNGGRKTTILDAVELVLFGKRAKCSKRGEKSYEDFLRAYHLCCDEAGRMTRVEKGYFWQTQKVT